jgi:hypothetical protein
VSFSASGHTQTPDPAVAAKFHETFAEPLSASKRAALSERYPMAGRRWRRVLHVSDWSQRAALRSHN